MLLLVDVGNTALKTAIFDGKEIVLCSVETLDWSKVTNIVYSHVASTEQLAQLLDIANSKQIPAFRAVVNTTCAGVSCGYENYQTLGIDRWLVVLACANEFSNLNKDIVIIDSGTATTIDVLNVNQQHLGGWIIPGLDLLVDSIASRAEKVFVNEKTPFRVKFGKDTPAALKNGCLVSTLGAVQYATFLLENEPLLVFAGGYGEFLKEKISSQLSLQAIYSEDLIFKGLLVW